MRYLSFGAFRRRTYLDDSARNTDCSRGISSFLLNQLQYSAALYHDVPVRGKSVRSMVPLGMSAASSRGCSFRKRKNCSCDTGFAAIA